MEPIWLLAHCILGKFLEVVCHCFPPPLDVTNFATTCLCVRSDARDPSSESWNCGRERCPVVILPRLQLPRKFRDLLHYANLRHGMYIHIYTTTRTASSANPLQKLRIIPNNHVKCLKNKHDLYTVYMHVYTVYKSCLFFRHFT